VLILDGWDEISISASEGFRQRLRHMLEQLRVTLLQSRQDPPVRVILTGRPSPDLTDSRFLLKDTPILTLRSIRPEHQRAFISRVGEQLQQARDLPESEWPTELRWSLGDLARYDSLLEKYEQEYDSKKEGGILEVLGLPLLAQVALRVMANETGDPAALVDNPTKLYRQLIDLTAPYAGKAIEDSATERAAHLSGRGLRRLLQSTASAITVHGKEEISFDELRIRLEELGHDLESEVQAIDEHEHGALHSLVVSYYFKGGRLDQGCEFLHKSFREYLHAERIVAALRDCAETDMTSLPLRQPYWKDFDEEDDPRYRLSRTLGRLLAPHWTSPEVLGHLFQLIAWQVDLAATEGEEPAQDGTPATTLSQWETVRDLLADLWDWWAEGVHQRPQPKRRRVGHTYSPPFAAGLVEWSSQQKVDRKDQLPAPYRITTADAHLGDALLQITAMVHSVIARQRGWPFKETVEAKTPVQRTLRPYQKAITGEEANCILFDPGRPGHKDRGVDPGWDQGDDREASYLSNYIARIEAAGWRPQGPGIARSFLSDVYLRGAHLSGAYLSGTDLSSAYLSSAYLSSADLRGTDLSGAYLFRANLSHADLSGADLIGADLIGAYLSHAKNLTKKQLAVAILDKRTELLEHLK
jgi:hypothetical protein